jgi:hypothetical protein
MADGFVQLPTDSTGKKLRTRDRGASGHDQYVVPTDLRSVSYHGRVGTFKTPGRAAVNQKVFALHNATGSAVLVDLKRLRVDVLQTAVKAVTIVVPVIRVYRVTVLPTNGTALTKVTTDTSQSSSASVTVFGDASADGTLSASALTATIPAGNVLAQTYAPRVFTAVGYEPLDTVEFFVGDETDVTLRALEGIVVFLESAVATTGIPATDQYIVSADWEEYTIP